MVVHRLLPKVLRWRMRNLSDRATLRVAAALTAASLMSGCATVALDQGGSLTSYSQLQPSDGVLTKSKLYAHEDQVLAARTVRIIPATIADKAKAEGITDQERRLVANAIDRSLCAGLSERFTVVAASDDADLTVHSLIMVMTPTDEKAVAASKGASIAKTVLLPGVPVPIPRIPIGLGSLSVEAEARGRDGRQEAAMVWGRGANALSGSARVSPSGDAYELASAFGDDFSRMLVTGKTPFGTLAKPPSMDRIQSWAGGAPKYAACEAFGREPGIAGLVGGAIGVPPDWNDKVPEAGTATAQAQ
ncbi:DUF3313 domain-containing protein [Bradyrhizobium cenepequi]|uniref:DUF3313 domain-containing protein n=1 Tax=Bradyrhizobium cenepequi TaxID=2821403 RepID=UPI001CE278AE|nr:DUF3313 domain-containing protein [Bradyrhizobium cenepequi]